MALDGVRRTQQIAQAAAQGVHGAPDIEAESGLTTVSRFSAMLLTRTQFPYPIASTSASAVPSISEGCT
jgi:hypothetical protein